jgi:hypothetical protein
MAGQSNQLNEFLDFGHNTSGRDEGTLVTDFVLEMALEHNLLQFSQILHESIMNRFNGKKVTAFVIAIITSG